MQNEFHEILDMIEPNFVLCFLRNSLKEEV